jgi:outer membrane biosynthesis protein TonB
VSGPKAVPKPAQPEPEREPQAKHEPQAKPEPTAEPAPKVNPETQAKPEPERKPEPEPKLKPEAKAEAKPEPERKPEPQPTPDLVLVVVPEEITLAVGESRRIAAFACVKGSAGAGPDERHGTDDDGCTRRDDVEWTLLDPGVATFADTGDDQRRNATALTATAAIDSTKIKARSGDLIADGELVIVPAEPAPIEQQDSHADGSPEE